jgi:hypothetical protein
MGNKEKINISDLIKGLAEREKNAIVIHKDLEDIMNNSTEKEISRNLGLLNLMDLLHIKSNLENTKAAFTRSENAIYPLLSSALSFGLGALSVGINKAETLREIGNYIGYLIFIVVCFYGYTQYLLFQKIDYHDNNVDVILSLTNLVIDNKKEKLKNNFSIDDNKKVIDGAVQEKNENKEKSNKKRDNKNYKKNKKKH